MNASAPHFVSVEETVWNEILDLLSEAFIEPSCDGRESGLAANGDEVACPSCRALNLLRRAGRKVP